MKGSCLCGGVQFEVDVDGIKAFQYCHCQRCQKVSGAGHAANIFVSPEALTWTKGQELVTHFSLPDTKYFASAFCKTCGGKLPWATQVGTVVMIPAGALDTPIPIKPSQSIFWGSRAPWYENPCDMPCHEGLPPRKGEE